MRILAFSDWRVQPLGMIADIVRTEKPDAILYAGDDLDRFVALNQSIFIKTPNHILKLKYPGFKPATIKQEKLLSSNFKKLIKEVQLPNNDIMKKLGLPFYYVNGNDDPISFADNGYHMRIHDGHFYKDGKDYFISESTTGKITMKEKIHIPSYPFPGNTELNYNEGWIFTPINPNFGEFKIPKDGEAITTFGFECEFGLKSKVKNKPIKYADIFLSHLPPLGVLDLSVRSGIDHIGSKELLTAIKKYQPRLVICGHSHIWGGFTKKIGNTQVINISSNDRVRSYGNYAVINTSDWSFEIRTIRDNTLRYIQGTKTFRDHVKEMFYINNTLNLDFDQRSDLCIKSNPEGKTTEEYIKNLKEFECMGVSCARRLRERYESLNWQNPKIIKKIRLNPDKFAFVDVETGLSKGLVPGTLWLIGLWYKGKLNQFLYPIEKKKFLKYLKRNKIVSMVCWSDYDRKVLHPILEHTGINMKFLDAYQRVSNCIIWHTYSLHELYNALFTDKNALDNLIPGQFAGLYANHLIIPKKSCPYCPAKAKIIEKIKERNRADILQMIEICRKLWFDLKLYRTG